MSEHRILEAIRYAIWGGLAAMCLLFGAGFFLSGFILPPNPKDSSDEIVQMYIDDKDKIRVGCVLMIFGFCFLSLWGSALAALFRRMEKRSPIFSYTQLACVAAITVIVIFIPLTWAVAAFRPGDIDPDVTRSINDAGWFLVLFPWPPLFIMLGVTAAAIFMDDSETPMFPRWTGYLSIWTALLSVPGGMILFFKSGPFAWNGVFAYWTPLLIFFVYVVCMSVVMHRIIDREQLALRSEAAGNPATAGVG